MNKTAMFLYSNISILNIKITKKEDIALCEALMKFTEDELYSL